MHNVTISTAGIHFVPVRKHLWQHLKVVCLCFICTSKYKQTQQQSSTRVCWLLVTRWSENRAIIRRTVRNAFHPQALTQQTVSTLWQDKLRWRYSLNWLSNSQQNKVGFIFLRLPNWSIYYLAFCDWMNVVNIYI